MPQLVFGVWKHFVVRGSFPGINWISAASARQGSSRKVQALVRSALSPGKKNKPPHSSAPPPPSWSYIRHWGKVRGHLCALKLQYGPKRLRYCGDFGAPRERHSSKRRPQPWRTQRYVVECVDQGRPNFRNLNNPGRHPTWIPSTDSSFPARPLPLYILELFSETMSADIVLCLPVVHTCDLNVSLTWLVTDFYSFSTYTLDSITVSLHVWKHCCSFLFSPCSDWKFD